MEFPQVVSVGGDVYRLGGSAPGPTWERLSVAETRWLAHGLRTSGRDAALDVDAWTVLEHSSSFEIEQLAVYRRRTEPGGGFVGSIVDLRSLTVDGADPLSRPPSPPEAAPELLPVTVRFVDLRLHDWQWRRMVGCAARLHTPVTKASETCDDAGEVSFRVHSIAEAMDATLETEAQEHDYHRARSVRVEELEPIEDPIGQRKRLDNLGYVGVLDDDDDGPSRYAIEEFQCDHDLRVIGVCDAATRGKLLEVHGH